MLNAIAKPFGILFMWLYDFLGNYGFAIIAFALIVRLILLPFMVKSRKSTARTSRLAGRMKELEKKHGANKQKYTEEMQKLYREENINPMSGCLWSLIPFPILLALYQAIRFPITIMMGVDAELLKEGGAIYNVLQSLHFEASTSNAYAQIEQAQFISDHFDAFAGISDKLQALDYSFFGLDLGAQPQWNFFWHTDWSNSAIWGPQLGLFLIPLLTAGLTYLSSKITMKANPTPVAEGQPNPMQSMTLIMPIMTLWFAFIMPAALGLYWIAGTLFTLIQDLILNQYIKKSMAKENEEFLERERRRDAELEAKRKETERIKAETGTYVNPNVSKKKQQKQQRLEKEQKTAEWEKAHGKKKKSGTQRDENCPDSAVGDRMYARGRAYDPNRYAEELAAIEAEEEEKPEELEGDTPEEDTELVLSQPEEPEDDEDEYEDEDDSEDFDDDDDDDDVEE